ncbi:MAG: MliC family protein [Pseudomonadota bacterium]
MRCVFLCLVVSSAIPAFAADPSFDCSKAQSSAEDLVCSDADLAALDVRLSSVYTAARDKTRAFKSGAKEAEKQLRASQRGWVKGRDDCWKAEDARTCIALTYRMREAQLVAGWMLEDPVSKAFWQCGKPADGVITMFFDTDMPGVRLEIGDRISTATRVRSASGSRYEGDFGESIWIKGENATYRAPDPDGTEKSCTRRQSG